MRYIERVYLDKQPETGDTIVATYTNRFGYYTEGNEMTVLPPSAYLSSNQVYALNHRTGKTVVITDGRYRIYKDITYKKTGEQHVVKRLFGIPIYSKTIDIYEEELTHD